MLPTEKTLPTQNLADLSILIYGAWKSGKSRWCAEGEQVLFLRTEPGLKLLARYEAPIHRWEDLLEAARELAEGNHGFRTVVIDTVDNAYGMCTEYICQRHGVQHESELDFGKGYSFVNKEFMRVLTKLGQLPYGLFLVSHAQDKEIETRTGKVTKSFPTLPDKVSKRVLGFVDLILFCDVETDGKTQRRVIRTKPSSTYEAGDRTGRLPATLDFDFASFAAAFEASVRPAAPSMSDAAAAVTTSAPGPDAGAARNPSSDPSPTSTAVPPRPSPLTSSAGSEAAGVNASSGAGSSSSSTRPAGTSARNPSSTAAPSRTAR